LKGAEMSLRVVVILSYGYVERPWSK
jgi:hypothetical protein